jgi:hypothetical protein
MNPSNSIYLVNETERTITIGNNILDNSSAHFLAQLAIGHGGSLPPENLNEVCQVRNWVFRFEQEEFNCVLRWFAWHGNWKRG